MRTAPQSAGDQPPATFLQNLADTLETEPHYSQVLLSTLPLVPGKDIVEMKGLVSAHVVKGQGKWKAISMSLSDAFGRRSDTLEKEFMAMEQECYRQLKQRAFTCGANAVAGITVQFGEASGEADLFYAVATGTALIVE